MQLCQFAHKILPKTFDNVLQLSVTHYCVCAISCKKDVKLVHRVFGST